MFSWFWPWRRRPVPLGHLHLILYTRRGCHLCEDAWKVLEEARRQFGFVLEAVDVDQTAELATRFDKCVPVVTVNDKIRFKGGVNPVLLRRLLQGEATRCGS